MSLDRPQRTTLHRTMDFMAAGDPAGLFEFLDAFHGQLKATVKRILTELNRPDVIREAETMAHLVQSAALVIFERSGSFRHDGALPWSWAQRAIRAEIVRFVGHPQIDLDQHPTIEADEPRAGSVDIDLDAIASGHEGVRIWLRTVRQVATPRDQRIHVEYQTQKGLGDRSPAQTLATMFGLSSANIRQIDRRVRCRVREVWDTSVATDVARPLFLT